MIGKNPTSTSKQGATTVEWLMRFWSPGAYESRWSESKRLTIRQVSCRILEPSDKPEMTERWRLNDIHAGFASIQPGLDSLEPGRVFALELDVPPQSMYRSNGPAGPNTGRFEVRQLPPRLHNSDVYDYQVRPARFWFEVEQVPGSDPPTMRIRVMHDDEHQHATAKRPIHARHRLRPDPVFPLSHVEIDWRPDWLRRGWSDIGPSGAYKLHGDKPTHVVLHAIGTPDGRAVSNVGAAINQFVNARGKGGIHYLVDVDGHVVKMFPDELGLAHSNTSYWRGKEGLNRRSVGVEHAWAAKPEVHPRAQIRATLDLVRQLKDQFGIDGRNVAGHGEVRCIDKDEALINTAVRTDAANRTPEQQQQLDALADQKRSKLLDANEKARKRNQIDKIKSKEAIEAEVSKYLKSKELGFDYDRSWGPALHPHSRLVSCPGRYFDWAYLADRGLVPDPWSIDLPADWKATAYSGVFASLNGLQLRPGDDDSSSTWGGIPRKDHAGTPVRELHDDLSTIGYAIPKDPQNTERHKFTEFLQHAVKAFKARYMQDKIGKYIDGNVDAATAEMIKRVTAAYAQAL